MGGDQCQNVELFFLEGESAFFYSLEFVVPNVSLHLDIEFVMPNVFLHLYIHFHVPNVLQFISI